MRIRINNYFGQNSAEFCLSTQASQRKKRPEGRFYFEEIVMLFL